MPWPSIPGSFKSAGLKPQPTLLEEDSMEEGCEEATPRIYTDGIYCWNDTLIEWVSQYHVQLPDDFLAHFHSMKYEPTPHEWLDAMALKALYETSEVVLVV